MEFKGTKGEWKKVFHKKTEYTSETYTIEYGEDGECISEWVQNEYDALLISKVPKMLEAMIEFCECVEMGAIRNTRTYNKFKQLIKEATEL